ncbi:hypothetical protein [Kordia sp.]|uniref:hypothetical protein n=1 Tax=Kordia sp. TaxID=1965332 RepID=UPI003D2A1943
MKKQNFKSLKLNKKSISNLHVGTLTGGRITWVNAECKTETCDHPVTEPVTVIKTCNYNSCVVCDM